MISEKNIEVATAMFAEQIPTDEKYKHLVNEFIGLCINDFREMYYPKVDSDYLGFMIPRYRFVIKNEDIKMADMIWQSVITGLATEYFSGRKNYSAIAGLAYAVYSLCRNAYFKGIIIDDKQCDLIMVLKDIGEPTTVDIINTMLGIRGNRSGIVWSKTIVQETLDSLQKVRMKNGNIISLVSQDSKGMWFCTDI